MIPFLCLQELHRNLNEDSELKINFDSDNSIVIDGEDSITELTNGIVGINRNKHNQSLIIDLEKANYICEITKWI